VHDADAFVGVDDPHALLAHEDGQDEIGVLAGKGKVQPLHASGGCDPQQVPGRTAGMTISTVLIMVNMRCPGLTDSQRSM
jgi:hypothetical protein